jgi:large subunit ribosomal protein L44e
MKYPKKVRIFCPYCKKHTEHTVSQAKRKTRSKLKHGARVFERKKRGYGSFPRPNPKNREKPTRKLNLLFKCKECGKKHGKGKGFRAKKFELKTKG